jgi:hypothetical protein
MNERNEIAWNFPFPKKGSGGIFEILRFRYTWWRL